MAALTVMKDKSVIADELIGAVRNNPKATSELEKLRGAMKDLAQLRAAGIAKGAPALKPPHSGRYDDPPKPVRATKCQKPRSTIERDYPKK